MSLFITAAIFFGVNPAFWGAEEKPKPGREGATTWNAGCFGGGEVRSGRIFSTSRKEPGQPWTKIRGMASSRVER